MFHRPVTRRTFVAGMLIVGTGTAGRSLSGGEPAKLNIADRQSLGGEDRYLTFVSTDKPIYRAGEKIYVRCVILHHAMHRPLPRETIVHGAVEIVGPKGDTVARGLVPSDEAVIGFSWLVPDDQPGGEYTAKITFPYHGHTPAERKFDIRAYRAPRLKTQIRFLRDGYGPGEEVVAMLHAERAEGGVPENANVAVVARVDDRETFRGPISLDHLGDGIARFRLPSQIERGEGTLAFIIDDQGIVETATKSLPILLQTVDVTIYPESGELVAGLENRVYVEAFTPTKKPADISGIVLDDTGAEVARFGTEHEGRARFAFTPRASASYALKIIEPQGISTRFPLPAVKPSGAVLRATQDIFGKSEPVVVEVAATLNDVLVTISKREAIVSRQAMSAHNGRPTPVQLSVPATADGVLTVTVWDMSGKPLAERLVFRQPSRSLRVTLTADAKSYSPGAKVRLQLKATDEHGKPASAIIGVTVADDSVLEMIEKREQSPRLPAMVLLEGEVRELADAHVYLDSAQKNSALAIDLLLGTQGWRRFALVDWRKFVESYQDRGYRVLAGKQPVVVARHHRSRALAVQELFFFEGQLEDRFAVPAAIPRNVNEQLDARDKFARPVQELRAAENVSRDREDRQDALVLAKAIPDGDARVHSRRGAIGGMGGFGGAGAPMPNDFVFVRVYAHELRGDRRPGDRVDFTETLYWHAGLRTDENGQASIEFALNDSVTTFRAWADAFDAHGGLGSSTAAIESVQPFYVEPKLPLEVTQNDTILLPVTCVNSTRAVIADCRVTCEASFVSPATASLAIGELPAGGRRRALLELQVGPHNGPFTVDLAARGGTFHDKVSRKIAVRPAGFPFEVARGGLIERDLAVRHELTVPPDMVEGSFESRIRVYPTPLANLTEALQALIREPCGCFEQTSSSVYPLIMAQQYFLTHHGVPPSLIERSAEILNRGYDRLRGFECKSGGFEWFGADPGHDALTAYGLMEFSDMNSVRPVDSALLDRTRTWLLAQRDGQGTFQRKTHTYHCWLAEPEVATAYNLWALLSAGVSAGLETEIKWVRRAADRTQNTYVTALVANILKLAGDRDGAAALLDKLAGKQAESGMLQHATVSVVGSTGQALEIETTALAVLAWLGHTGFTHNVEAGIRFLAEQCQGGRFGSTQSTILALKAIVAYDQSRAHPKAPGELQLIVDGRPLGEPVKFDEMTQGAIELPSLPVLPAGQHTVEIRMSGGSQMPHSVLARCSRLTPDSSESCKLHLETTLRDLKMTEGSVTEAKVVVVNRSGESVPAPIALIGIPGGLEVRHDQLKELVKAGTIAAYEVLGREVVLYWRALPPEARVTLPLSLVAAVPGSYTGPASRAYLYYTPEDKHWIDGLRIQITPIKGLLTRT